MHHVYTIASLLLMCCFLGYSMGRIYGFAILPDEFGYWSYAAAAAGYDWSEIVSLNSYYSYGYSVILFPVFVLFRDGLTAYRAAIIVNFMMLAGIGFMLRYLAVRLFPDRKGQLSTVLAAVITLYPPLLLYTRTTMAETMLVFLYVLITILIYQYLERRRATGLFLLLVALVYIHFVHMRTVALLAAGLLTALIDRLFLCAAPCRGIMSLRRRMGRAASSGEGHSPTRLHTDAERKYAAKAARVRRASRERWLFPTRLEKTAKTACGRRQNRSELCYLAVVIMAVVLFVLGMCARGTILEMIYSNTNGEQSAISQINDYRGQSGKLQYIMTAKGFGNLMISLAGKVLYLGLATFGTALWGLRYAWKAVIYGSDRKKRVFWCFVFLSAVGALALSAVYTVYPGRVDALAYGRYHEYVFPVLMLAGLYEMWHTRRLWEGMLLHAALELCMLAPVLYSLHRYHQTSLHACMVFGMSYLYNAENPEPMSFYIGAYGLGILLMLVVTALVSIGRRGKKQFPVLMLMAVMEVLLALRASSAVIDTGSIGAYRDSVVADRITELIGDYSDEEQLERRVLYVDGGGDSSAGMIQFMLRDIRITVLDQRESIEDYGEDEMGQWDLVLTGSRDDYGRELGRRYEYTLSSGHFALYYNRKE